MRIAHVAPLWTSIPPSTYGGTESIVHLLTEELVIRGHDVTLFAVGDSQTKAKLRPICDSNLVETMRQGKAYQYEPYVNASFSKAICEQDSFDLIHCHLGCNWLPFAALSRTPILYSVGSAVTIDDLWLLQQYPDACVTFRSDDQIAIIPHERRQNIRVIYNACDFDSFELSIKTGTYLAFLGRMSSNKNPLGAIEIAKEVGLPLVMAGEPMNADENKYFVDEIEPAIDGESVIYLGAVNHQQKVDLLKNAAAFLFPIQWSEPFGIVMIEAMACGTPAIACKQGSVPEVIDFGQTGFYAESVDELVPFVSRAMSLDRRTVRERARQRFGVERMVDEYIAVYSSLV